MKPPSNLITLIFLIFFCSWGKNAHVNAQNTIDLKLTKIISDSLIVYEFLYNNANLISEEKSKQRYTKYNYNEKDELISIDYYDDPAIFSSSMEVIEASRKREEWTSPDNTEKSYSTNYEYNTSGQLIKSTNYPGYIIFDYDRNNRISRQTYFHDDIISNYVEFKYDKKGNLIKRNTFQVSETGRIQLTNKTLFEFDNKHNPFKALNNLMLPGKYSNPNNIVKTISANYYLIENMEDDINTIITSFEYNQYSYPVTVDGKFEYVYE